jgi:hypothetical protein
VTILNVVSHRVVVTITRGSQAEPDAVEAARPVRRAGRRNPPAERLTGRSCPAPTQSIKLLEF